MKLRALFTTLTAFGLACFLVVGCGNSSTSKPPASTVTVTSAGPTSTRAAASGPITLPDVLNQNANIARKKLEKLGLTDLTLSSTNPKYQNVINAANWTVVGMEPAAGSVVQSDESVVLKVYKD